MSSRAIATSTLWQLASQVTMAALSILTVKFVAIGLSQELAGNYNSAYGYLQLFGILADFGLYAVAVREVSKATDRERVLGTLMVLRIIILVLSLVSALVLVWALPQWRGTPLPLGVTIAALVPFFTLLAGVVRTVFQIHYKMQYVFIAEVIQRIITVSLIALFIIAGTRGTSDVFVYHAFLLIGGIGAFVLLILSFFFANKLMKVRLHFDWELLKKLFVRAAPFGLAYLCMALYRQFDITMIALLRPDFEIQNAYYGFVVRMSDMGFIIPTFLLNSTLPVLSERDSKGMDTRSLLGKTFLILLILGSISALFSALWSRPIMQLLTTESYLSTIATPGSDTALQLMSIPLFLNSMVLYSFYVLLNKHAWKRLVATLSVAAIASLILNYFLIPPYGFVGACYTAIIIHIGLVIVLLPQGLHVMPIALTRKHMTQWATFTAATAALLWLFRGVLTNELTTVIALSAATIFMIGVAWAIGLHKLISSKESQNTVV